MKAIITLLLLTNLLGCSIMPQSASRNTNEELAVINNYAIDNGFISFETISHGCTFYTNFKVDKGNETDNQLKIIQLVKDQCKMTPRKIMLSYSFRHIGLAIDEKIELKNQSPNTLSRNLLIK
jgi:hypothetical protein